MPEQPLSCKAKATVLSCNAFCYCEFMEEPSNFTLVKPETCSLGNTCAGLKVNRKVSRRVFSNNKLFCSGPTTDNNCITCNCKVTTWLLSHNLRVNLRANK